MPTEIVQGPKYTDEIRDLFKSLGQRFRADESITQAFLAEIAARPDCALRRALQSMLDGWESFSAGDSRTSQQMLAHHRDVFPVPVIAAVWELEGEGEIQNLSDKLEPITGAKLIQSLEKMRDAWRPNDLGEFPQLRELADVRRVL